MFQMFKNMLRHVMQRYDRINGTLLAKGLGFSLILGILPLLFIALSIGAYVINITPDVYQAIVDGLSEFIPMGILQNYLSQVVDFSENWRSLSLFTLVFFLIFSLSLFNSLGRVLRTILSRRQSTATRHNLISLMLLSVSLLLLYASMLFGTQFDIWGELVPISSQIANWADFLIDAFVIAIILTVLFYIYSNRTIDIFPTLMIALFSGGVLKAVSSLGVIIIQSMSRRISIFGAMATPIMLLMYLRIFGEILIFSSLTVDYYNSRKIAAKTAVPHNGEGTATVSHLPEGSPSAVPSVSDAESGQAQTGGSAHEL